MPAGASRPKGEDGRRPALETTMSQGKKFTAAAAKVDTAKLYDVPQAVALVKSAAFAKFNETVEIAMRLGVDPKHADQMVRGTVVLPHGLGKSTRVAVVASGRGSRRPRTRAPTSSAETTSSRRSPGA